MAAFSANNSTISSSYFNDEYNQVARPVIDVFNRP